jgi:hypothetical protein
MSRFWKILALVCFINVLPLAIMIGFRMEPEAGVQLYVGFVTIVLAALLVAALKPSWSILRIPLSINLLLGLIMLTAVY